MMQIIKDPETRDKLPTNKKKVKNQRTNRNPSPRLLCPVLRGMSSIAVYFYLISHRTLTFRCVVWTGDGKVFFFNPSTKNSVWEKPAELKNRADVDKLLKAPSGSMSPTNDSHNAKKAKLEDEEVNRIPAKKQK